MSYLRRVPRRPTGWTLSDGDRVVGTIVPGKISLTGFPDTDSATMARNAAAAVARDWAGPRTLDDTHHPTSPQPSPDGLGFEYHMPADTWHALQLELAQRMHTTTHALRHQTPEPAA
ncbi:MAG: hypothetical protein IT361_04360 [Gemmatimonadaceae bacterium]|nr:hypothetical protein [Gemmatimonadaceae bacterium]